MAMRLTPLSKFLLIFVAVGSVFGVVKWVVLPRLPVDAPPSATSAPSPSSATSTASAPPSSPAPASAGAFQEGPEVGAPPMQGTLDTGDRPLPPPAAPASATPPPSPTPAPARASDNGLNAVLQAGGKR